MSVVRCGKCGGFISGIPERTYEHPCTCTRPVDQIVYPIADAAYWKARAEAAEARAERLQAELDAAGDNVMEIIAQALSGDCQRYLNYDETGRRYCKWGIVEKDIRAIFKKEGGE